MSKSMCLATMLPEELLMRTDVSTGCGFGVCKMKKMQPATSLKNQLMYCKINLKSLYWSLM